MKLTLVYTFASISMVCLPCDFNGLLLLGLRAGTDWMGICSSVCVVTAPSDVHLELDRTRLSSSRRSSAYSGSFEGCVLTWPMRKLLR